MGYGRWAKAGKPYHAGSQCQLESFDAPRLQAPREQGPLLLADFIQQPNSYAD